MTEPAIRALAEALRRECDRLGLTNAPAGVVEEFARVIREFLDNTEVGGGRYG